MKKLVKYSLLIAALFVGGNAVAADGPAPAPTAAAVPLPADKTFKVRCAPPVGADKLLSLILQKELAKKGFSKVKVKLKFTKSQNLALDTAGESLSKVGGLFVIGDDMKVSADTSAKALGTAADCSTFDAVVQVSGYKGTTKYFQFNQLKIKF